MKLKLITGVFGVVIIFSSATTKKNTIPENIVTADTLTKTEFTTKTYKLKSNSIPDSVFQMTDLKTLSITGMHCIYVDTTRCWVITKIPPQIKNLKQLETLQLNINAIDKIPAEITELKNLRVLDLTENKYLSNVDCLTNLENLEELYLFGCSISKLPDDIGKLKKLKKLGLMGNPIAPSEIDRIKQLLPDCQIIFSNKSN